MLSQSGMHKTVNRKWKKRPEKGFRLMNEKRAQSSTWLQSLKTKARQALNARMCQPGGREKSPGPAFCGAHRGH